MSEHFFWNTKWSILCFASSFFLILCGPVALENQYLTVATFIYSRVAFPFHLFEHFGPNSDLPIFLRPIWKVALFSASFWGLGGAILDLAFSWQSNVQERNASRTTPIVIVASCFTLCVVSVGMSLPTSIEQTVLAKLGSTDSNVRVVGLVEAYRIGMDRRHWLGSLQDRVVPGGAEIAARKLKATEMIARNASEMAIAIFAANHDKGSRLCAMKAIGALRLLPEKARPAVIEAIESSDAE